MVSLPVFEERPSENQVGSDGGCEAAGGEAARCGNGLEKVYKTTAVRYGFMKHIGEFSHAETMKFTCGAKVVVQTRRGIEIGQQVSLSCSGCDKHVSREQIRRYIQASGADSYILDNGRILREATPADLAEHQRLVCKTTVMKSFAQEQADALRLKMKMVECEYLFGGERAIFYFLSQERVDFRPLVKELAEEFQTRIKMHQVGARDEARLLADYETCGREVCCKTFLKTLKPVNMKMAKLQRATLDPSKVSGRCGRLKCCLRYEHTSYQDLDVALPRLGEKVRTTDGYGTVVRRQILTQLIQIERLEGGRVTVLDEDVLERRLRSLPELERVPTANSGAGDSVENERKAPHGRSAPRPRRTAVENRRRNSAEPTPKPPSPKETNGAGDAREPKPSGGGPEPSNEEVSSKASRKRRRGKRRRGRRGGSGGRQGPSGQPG